MNKRVIFSIILSFTLIGCASKPQLPINLDRSTFLGSNNRVGVAMDQIPEPVLSLPGASCLLCAITAAAANTKLSGHVKTFSTGELAQLKDEVASQLKSQGKNIVLIDEALDVSNLPKYKSENSNAAKHDFSSFAEKFQIDQLLVIDINEAGAVRRYSSYFPTGEPQARIVGKSYLVDLKSNLYRWYMPINLRRGAEGQWKEPPEFPGLTNAYYQLVEQLRDDVLEPIKSN